MIGSNIVAYFIALVVDLILISFFKWGFETPKLNNIWFILCLVFSFTPMLNFSVPIIILTFVFVYNNIEEHYYKLKDNKFNRFLFGNKFENNF